MSLVDDYYELLRKNVPEDVASSLLPTDENVVAAKQAQAKSVLGEISQSQAGNRKRQERFRNNTAMGKTIYQIQSKQMTGDLLITKSDTVGSNNAKGY